jgi:hypothetical protein
MRNNAPSASAQHFQTLALRCATLGSASTRLAAVRMGAYQLSCMRLASSCRSCQALVLVQRLAQGQAPGADRSLVWACARALALARGRARLGGAAKPLC